MRRGKWLLTCEGFSLTTLAPLIAASCNGKGEVNTTRNWEWWRTRGLKLLTKLRQRVLSLLLLQEGELSVERELPQ